MTLLLREADVERLLDMRAVIDAVADAERERGSGAAWNLARRRLRMPAGTLHTMAAALPSKGLFGLKAYTSVGGAVRFKMMVYGLDGALVALIEAGRLGQLRTGAATAVATRALARPGARKLGLIGAGYQAEGQLEALREVLPNLAEVRVFARNRERAAAFAERWRARIGVRVDAVESASQAADGVDVLVTATTAREPVLDGAAVPPGCHVNAVGANMLVRREIDTRLLTRAALVTVDSREQAQLESGALLQAMETGHLHWEQLHELADVLAGRVARRAAEDITVFHSLGLALWDIAAAAVLLERARAAGAGETLALE